MGSEVVIQFRPRVGHGDVELGAVGQRPPGELDGIHGRIPRLAGQTQNEGAVGLDASLLGPPDGVLCLLHRSLLRGGVEDFLIA